MDISLKTIEGLWRRLKSNCSATSLSSQKRIETNMGSAVEKGHTGSEVRSEEPGRIRLCAPKIATSLRWIIRIEFDSKAKRMLKAWRHPVNQPVFNSRLASEMRGHTKLDESSLAQTGFHTVTVTGPCRTNAPTWRNLTLWPAPWLTRKLAQHGTLGCLLITHNAMNRCNCLPPIDIR